MGKRTERLLAFVLLVAAIAIFGCGHKQTAAPESIPVTVQTVATAIGAAGGAYSANIVADTQVNVAFKVNGYVQSILQVKACRRKTAKRTGGRRVTAGAVLAVVKDDTYRNSLDESSVRITELARHADQSEGGFRALHASAGGARHLEGRL